MRDATLETTVALVAAQGLRAVTMSRIAEETGIGRATLYKYFPDVESILVAWHDEQVASHIAQLGAIAERNAEPIERLTAVLEGYAVIQHDLRTAHGTELVALLHHRKHVVTTRQHLNDLVEKLLAEGAAAGQVRGDVAPAEMASYCLHALSAASAAVKVGRPAPCWDHHQRAAASAPTIGEGFAQRARETIANRVP